MSRSAKYVIASRRERTRRDNFPFPLLSEG